MFRKAKTFCFSVFSFSHFQFVFIYKIHLYIYVVFVFLFIQKSIFIFHLNNFTSKNSVGISQVASTYFKIYQLENFIEFLIKPVVIIQYYLGDESQHQKECYGLSHVTHSLRKGLKSTQYRCTVPTLQVYCYCQSRGSMKNEDWSPDLK